MKANSDKHAVAMIGPLGWKFVNSLKELNGNLGTILLWKLREPPSPRVLVVAIEVVVQGIR